MPRQAGRKHNCDSKLSVYVELSNYLASYCESHIIVQQKMMKSNILQISGKLKQLHFCFVYYLLLLTAKDYIFNRGVTIRFNNDSIRITIHGCRYDTRTILVHLERYDPKRFSDLKSIQ